MSSPPAGNSVQGELSKRDPKILYQIYSTVHEETLIRTPTIHLDVFNKDGFLADIDVQVVPEVPKKTLKDRSHDVNHLFSLPYQKKDKNYHNCHLCS